MTIVDAPMLGSTVEDLKTMEELGIRTGDPDMTYQPFSAVDKLGDLSDEGNGFPIVVWHYAGLYPGDADIFYDFLDGDISAPVIFRSRLNRLNEGKTDYLWITATGIMSWMFGDEQNPVLHTMDVTMTFTVIEIIPDYP